MNKATTCLLLQKRASFLFSAVGRVRNNDILRSPAVIGLLWNNKHQDCAYGGAHQQQQRREFSVLRAVPTKTTTTMVYHETKQYQPFFPSAPPPSSFITRTSQAWKSTVAATTDAETTSIMDISNDKNDSSSFTLARRHGMRCLAIVAHVDHGKTSLVDKLLQASQQQQPNNNNNNTTTTITVDRLLDSGDLEKERGITITSKVTRLIHDYKHHNNNNNKSADEDDDDGSIIINIADSTYTVI